MREMVADGVEYTATTVEQDDYGVKGVHAISVEYLIGEGWKVTLTADLDADTETSVARLVFEPGEGAKPVDGINSSLLRMIPFRHANAQIQAAVLRAWSEGELPVDIPAECDDAADYAALATAYERFAERFPAEPLQKMSEVSKINKNTLAARVNRAKALGFLTRSKETGRYQATDAANEALYG